MNEIVSLKEDFSKYATELTAKVQTLRTKTLAINKLNSFDGATANAAKAYFTKVHGELLQELEETMKHIEKNLTKIVNEFQSVDRSQSAIIKENYLQTLRKNVQIIDQEVLDIHSSEKMTIQKISDIVALSPYKIHTFSSSIHESKRFLQQTIEDLYQFDQRALKIAKNSEEQVSIFINKMSRQQLERLASMSRKINISRINKGEESSLSDLINDGISSLRHILAGLSTTDKWLTTFYQCSVLFQMNKHQRRELIKTGRHALTLAQYRRFNNMLRFSPYKMSTKEFLRYYRDKKAKRFPKGRLETFKRLVIPYGKNRGKLAMMKEFDRLYGLEKYQKFKSLKTKPAKVTSIGKTFYDEIVGNKIKTTKNIVKNSSWNKPETFLKSVADEFQVKTQNTNVLGKGAKVVSRSLGPLSAGLHIRENFIQNKGDTQKIIVGSAVDIATGSVATATGAAVGSAFLPPIGTVVGAGVGMLVSAGFHKKFGEPPKSVTDHVKDLANKAIDGVKNVAKSIGKKISSWFK